jgi:hypothetical protein
MPVVVQVPDFGNRFYVYQFADARTDAFGEIGKQYGTKPGFYLLAGPNWKGTIPDGITGVIHSPTDFAGIFPRVFQDDTPEDKAAVQPLLSQVVVYPLAEFAGKMKTMDWKSTPAFPAAFNHRVGADPSVMVGCCGVYERATTEGITAVAFGDLFLQEIREYRVRQLQGSGLEPMFPAWHIPTEQLGRDMTIGGASITATSKDGSIDAGSSRAIQMPAERKLTSVC